MALNRCWQWYRLISFSDTVCVSVNCKHVFVSHHPHGKVFLVILNGEFQVSGEEFQTCWACHPRQKCWVDLYCVLSFQTVAWLVASDLVELHWAHGSIMLQNSWKGISPCTLAATAGLYTWQYVLVFLLNSAVKYCLLPLLRTQKSELVGPSRKALGS